MESSHFKDNFSKQASLYALYRPTYPKALFSYLASLCEEQKLAWDCGAGNGQGAIELAHYFDEVFASDPSAEQIKHAMVHDRVTYACEKAEHSSLKSNSVDLLVVAQALHWFHHEQFFIEAQRVMKPNGVLAVVSYVNPTVNTEIDRLIDKLHDTILSGYWRAENKLIFEEYQSIAFPFETRVKKDLAIERMWTLKELIGHLRTWSAVQRYIDEQGVNPIDQVHADLEAAWGDETTRLVTWPLHVIIGVKTEPLV